MARTKSKGQVEMIETIMVLVMLMVVIIIGLIFYFGASSKSIEEKGSQTCMQTNEVILSSLAMMPELICSIGGNTLSNCIDTAKLVAYEKEREEGKSWVQFAANCKQRVYFELVYPSNENAVNCTQANYPDCSIWQFYEQKGAFSGGIRISMPVSLYFPGSNEYKMGKAVVEIE
ncbi:hypothetical protein HZB88_02895 [archaeon]|nr:hypothetical protein [archaeon]